MNLKSSKQILESPEGLKLAFSEVEKIKAIIQKTVLDTKEKAPNECIKARDNNYHLYDIIYMNHSLIAQFYHRHENSAEGTYILFAVVDGIFDGEGNLDNLNPVNILETISLRFTFDDNDNFGWQDIENESDFYTSETVTKNLVSKFFESRIPTEFRIPSIRFNITPDDLDLKDF